ncbi:MAG: pectinesterase family protein [Ignavibacteriales bacterium]|nr:pectinesterase family protein [Ignavibacteriales bacterium]
MTAHIAMSCRTISLLTYVSKISQMVIPFVLSFIACTFVAMAQRQELIVAKDGSGDYRTIQEAIDAIPENNATMVFINIRKGLYEEKLFLTKSNVCLLGEDRDSTRIVYAQLREEWNRVHAGKDWGAAVVNIDSLASDITIANLTIYNNYGSLYGSVNHQFAIRGGGTRIILLNCTVKADGGDTVSLWNRQSGMYYHANCWFEGWVDFVCPRGWCFITDSRFYGHNLSASIWHDGSTDRNQKLVIRSSYFDGVPGFPLGRHHRDGAIYLLDCRFSKNMADKPIYYPVNPNSIWHWGDRHYFYNCHRDGGDYEWFCDNLDKAEGRLVASQITPQWTFGGRWDPEPLAAEVLKRIGASRSMK